MNAANESENPYIGSSFDDFLREDGIRDEVDREALKRVLAFELSERMRQIKVSKAEMARRMGTSRSSLDRLLDPAHPSATIDTVVRAAQALGLRARIILEDVDGNTGGQA